VKLEGRYGSLEKLDARHGADLFAAFNGHPGIWDYMPSGPFENAGAFGEWLKDRATLDDPYFYTILDTDGRAVGMAALMRITPDMGVIEVGNIAYSPALQRTPLGTEAQYLLAAYAFDTLHYRRYEWKCNALNAASRRAAERYGFTFEGIFRQHMIVKGRNRDTAWFSITDGEWPARKAAFERWLSPTNFDALGRQKTRLNAQVSQGG
jgi:RimJ/RimL family protein N-acetyltransferase